MLFIFNKDFNDLALNRFFKLEGEFNRKISVVSS